MKLYYFAGACSLADHIVLEWVGEPYETVRMTLASIKSREYLALNPNGTVPLLSTAISCSPRTWRSFPISPTCIPKRSCSATARSAGAPT